MHVTGHSGLVHWDDPEEAEVEQFYEDLQDFPEPPEEDLPELTPK